MHVRRGRQRLLTVGRAFGDPCVSDNPAIIPAAAAAGRVGGDGRHNTKGEDGEVDGFGLTPRSLGAAAFPGAVGLGILFPVSFISNVFVAGDMPPWLDTVGSVLPLKRLAHSLVTALDTAGPFVSWTSVAVMTAWLVVAGVVAVRVFRWEPRR